MHTNGSWYTKNVFRHSHDHTNVMLVAVYVFLNFQMNKLSHHFLGAFIQKI